MTRRAVAVALMLLATLLTGRADARQTPAPQNISWQSAGDSYSSGEGVFNNEGECAQSSGAYGPLAALRLGNDHGWEFSSKTFTACTGHLVENYFNNLTGDPDIGSLWDWGREQGGPERVDVIAMSFGGNDIGFSDLIKGCLIFGLPETWSEAFVLGVKFSWAAKLTGCDESEEELTARVDALLDPTQTCSGYRKDGPFDCDLDIGERRGSIIDFYYDIVTQRLTPRGRLYVVGYPRIFADTDQWPAWNAVACSGVKRGDTQKLGRVAEHLNNKLQEAAGRANDALGSERVVFVDRFAAYRDGQHELCGRGEDWLNGVAADRADGIEIHLDTSFHPNAFGHRNTAEQLVERVLATFPSGLPHTFKNLTLTLPSDWTATTDGSFLKVRPAGCADAACEAWLGGTDIISTGHELGPWDLGKLYYPATDARCAFPMVRDGAIPVSSEILDQGGRPVGGSTASFQRQVAVCQLADGTRRTTDLHIFHLPESQIIILDATGTGVLEAALAAATLTPPAPAAATPLEATRQLSAAVRDNDLATAAIYAEPSVIETLRGGGGTPPRLGDGRCGPAFGGRADCSTWIEGAFVTFPLELRAGSHGWRAVKASFVHTG